MPSFSSVVRKPGQKIQPKGPKRNVQRNPVRHVAPPSLTPESQTVSPAIEPVDKVSENQDPAPEPEPEQEPESESQVLETAHDTGALPSIIPSIVPSIIPSIETARETLDRTSSGADAKSNRVAPGSVEIRSLGSGSHGVQIIHPVHAGEDNRTTLSNEIPTISVAAAPTTAHKRKATRQPTPTPSEDSGQERDAIGPARKRQKSVHAAEIVEELVTRGTPPIDTLSSLLRTRSPRLRRSESRTSDALLQDATTQAAAVSELANDIENRARSIRSQSERTSISQAAGTGESTAEESTQSQSKRVKKRKISKSARIRELAQQVVERAVGGGKDKDNTENRHDSRLSTPENAEELEIDPQEVSMSELTKDIKIGRKSETEKKMQENWAEIKERRKKEVEKRRQAAQKKKKPSAQEEPEPEETAAPVQIIIDGQIVVSNESREVALHAGLEQAVRENADVAIEDDRIYKYVNQGTLGKNAGREKRSKWNEQAINLFYQGLRMFGTDFSMIANLFPENVDRRVIKKKYLLELQSHPEKVDECVTAKEFVSLDDYTAMTNMEFEDPEALEEELEAEAKRLREEDEKRRADQGYVMNNEEADVPIPSTERDEGTEVEAETGVEGEQVDDDTATSAPTRRTQAPSTARNEKIRAVAERVVQDAVAPKKKQQRRTRESTGTGRGGRGGRKGKRTVEGVEERIGPLDDIDQ